MRSPSWGWGHLPAQPPGLISPGDTSGEGLILHRLGLGSLQRLQVGLYQSLRGVREAGGRQRSAGCRQLPAPSASPPRTLRVLLSLARQVFPVQIGRVCVIFQVMRPRLGQPAPLEAGTSLGGAAHLHGQSHSCMGKATAGSPGSQHPPVEEGWVHSVVWRKSYINALGTRRASEQIAKSRVRLAGAPAPRASGSTVAHGDPRAGEAPARGSGAGAVRFAQGRGPSLSCNIAVPPELEPEPPGTWLHPGLASALVSQALAGGARPCCARGPAVVPGQGCQLRAAPGCWGETGAADSASQLPLTRSRISKDLQVFLSHPIPAAGSGTQCHPGLPSAPPTLGKELSPEPQHPIFC